ncbi:hypothetical protein JG688_00005767 [Phytophthora aleatoria]|uniref:Serine-threonine/tyrosine-protein kinase catalytic domain-containing protein n=1 Tax=Phytophthora aleatoria TaxID=2496075 RepID=A0A8J5IRH3_9STRA|nr:hypothetical protein JG688_00005767 [Phytophthora aleatoria]
MSVLLDLVIPGSETVVDVLKAIVGVCIEMKESQESCARLHQRLKDIFDELLKMEKRKRLPSSTALDKYVRVVANYLQYLEHYRGKKLILRLIEHQKMMGELLLINEEVDTLFKILGLAGIDAMMEWRQVWTADQRVQQELMTTMVANTATVMGELQNTRAQLEAMMLLQFETEQRSERHSDNAMQLMQSMMSTVVKGSKATVEKLPPWFLPSSELEFEPEAFAQGSFASVHRGVWGSGTHVVVKRFLVDDSTEVDVSVKLQIEAEMNLWHQFNHPNIIKMFGASHVSSPPFIVCEDATNGLGLDYMHKKRVVHGDLKLNNILPQPVKLPSQAVYAGEHPSA